MSSDSGSWLVRSAAGICRAMMPSHLRGWAEAMAAEIEAIPDSKHALSYALGCVFACGRERMRDMNSVEKWAGIALPFVMVTLAASTGLASWRNSAVDPAVGLVFALLSAVMVMTAIWSLWRGPAALVQAASLMVVLNLVSLLSLRGSPTAQHWANARLYDALAIEGVVIWTALLAGGLWLADRQRRAGRA